MGCVCSKGDDPAAAGNDPAYSRNPSPALRHDSILTTVGSTPLVKLQRMAPEGVDVYVKVEAANPTGSVKDRLALGVIEWALAHGELKPGQTVVEASSGNTGIGLAMVCAVKGHPFVCVMSEAFSIERRKLMRFLGAKVVLTNPAHKASGMIIKARELAATHGWFLPCQFENQANAWVHAQTTGPEILAAMAGVPIGHFFVAYGTGGTLKGVSSVLRERSPATQIHVCEPDNAPLLFSGVQTEYPTPTGTYEGTGSFVTPHPVWRPHLLQGWTADFIPKLVSEAVNAQCVDEIHHVSGVAAMETARRLAREEGILTGTSGGGTLSAALKFADELKRTQSPPTSIVVMLADTGERYLSTPLFADIPADMTDEEKALAASTPSTPPPGLILPEVNEAATNFVTKSNTGNKVVVWSLVSCEFCWTLSMLLNTLKVDYVKIDIDSFQYAKDNLGNQYRAALQAQTKCATFPQFFVDGTFHGGAVDACLKWKKGELQTIFARAKVAHGPYDGDPFEFLPKWMSQNPLRSK